MSAQTQQDNIRQVAEDAVNQLEIARDYLDWFSSLGFAMSNSLETGHNNHALRIAGAVQFLADNYRNVIDSEVKKFSEQLGEIDVGA